MKTNRGILAVLVLFGLLILTLNSTRIRELLFGPAQTTGSKIAASSQAPPDVPGPATSPRPGAASGAATASRAQVVARQSAYMAELQQKFTAAQEAVTNPSAASFQFLVNVATNAHEDWLLRSYTARALGRSFGEEAVPYLSLLLEDPTANVNIRYAAAVALGRVGSDEAVSTLAASLHDTNPVVRFKAIQSLKRTGKPSAVPHLSSALDDPDKYAQVQAIDALSELGASAAAPRITSILESPGISDFTSAACLDALGQLGGDDSMEILKRYAQNENQAIRTKAKTAMNRITERKRP